MDAAILILALIEGRSMLRCERRLRVGFASEDAHSTLQLPCLRHDRALTIANGCGILIL